MPWDNARPKPNRAKYGTAHKRLRAAINKRMQAGEIFCCWRCGIRLHPGPDWHLGHDDTGTRYLGPECVPCNIRDGARRARAKQGKVKHPPKPWRSRTW